MSAPQTVAKPTLNAVPILPSLNFSQTREFYVGNLGFEEIGIGCEDYMVVQRDGMELRFWLSDDPMHCENSSVFFVSGSPAEIYQDLVARGIEAIKSADCQDHPVQFHVRDPHGNLLMFSEAPGIRH